MRINEVFFAEEKLRDSYLELEKGKFEEKELFRFITRAIDDIEQNPFCGIKIPKKFWPKGYILKHQIDNLWKYNVPNQWRMIYTIIGNEIKIICMILEWFNHKEYERRFHY